MTRPPDAHGLSERRREVYFPFERVPALLHFLQLGQVSENSHVSPPV
jgi:hypothetical protein